LKRKEVRPPVETSDRSLSLDDEPSERSALEEVQQLGEHAENYLSQHYSPEHSQSGLQPSRGTSSSSALNFNHQLSEDEEDLSSKPRCQSCRQGKKGCDRQRPCQRCKAAGFSAEQRVPEDEVRGQKRKYGHHIGVPVKKLTTKTLQALSAGGPPASSAPLFEESRSVSDGVDSDEEVEELLQAEDWRQSRAFEPAVLEERAEASSPEQELPEDDDSMEIDDEVSETSTASSDSLHVRSLEFSFHQIKENLERMKANLGRELPASAPSVAESVDSGESEETFEASSEEQNPPFDDEAMYTDEEVALLH
jgi:hypothetical protein